MSTTRLRARGARRVPPGDLRRSIRLFRRFMGSPRVYLVGALLLVFEATTAVIEPYPIAYLIDFLQSARPSLRDLGVPAFLASERFETILLLTLAIVLIAAINSAADSLTEVCMARGGRSLGYSIRIAMYSHLQRLPLAYHDRRRTGDVLTRVTGDVLVVEDFVVKSISNILGSLLVLVGSFAFLLYQSWSVALIAVLVVPLLAIVSNHYSRRIKVVSKTQRDREGDLASTAQEMLTSIRLVQSYGCGTVDLQRFSGQTERSMQASLGAANIQAQFSFVIALLEAVAISAVIWLGVWLVDRSAITIGTLVLFVLLLQNMFKPARKIVSEWYKIGKVFASVERIQDLLDREVVVKDLPGAVPAPPLEGRLTFRNVSFTYPLEHEDGTPAASRPPVLNDIDFEVPPGAVIALVGLSGAGKSTIAQLVPRLYDPDRGEVLVDGLPVRSLTLASLRSQVSVVHQETVLLSGTVAENIGYGITDATPAEIESAARMANAHDFIIGMPEGYQTQLGERGSTLSGGQRQRIAIARAFIRRAPILILDEPTTGLDQESAQSVIGALRSLMRGTTTIVISHDPALIRCADRVLVISGGRIVETGRHETLLRSGGAYAELYSRDVLLNEEPGRVEATSSAAAGHDPDEAGLLSVLEGHLPGLASATDPRFAATQLERLLLNGSVEVQAVSVEKLWLRHDGTCTMRYRVQFPGPSGSTNSNATVLGHVHSDEAGATREADALLAPPEVRRISAEPPWRGLVGVAAEAPLTLSRFPIDPFLPTLPHAMDPEVLGGLEPFTGLDQPPVVRVVHHPREGPCVLCYQVGRPGAGHPPQLETVYGKVYGDDQHGGVVDGFLRALACEHDQHGVHLAARFPRPVLFEPALRLLLTEALPGEPLVPRLLKSMLASRSGARAQNTTALRDAVRSSGRALAALHGSDLATAPVRPAGHELSDLQAEIDVVARIWPDVAAHLLGKLDRIAADVPTAPDMVLSHGDFTPSQVLLGGRGQAEVPAVVDLDTLCWADPALDLGRYLAHLEVLAVKAGGPAARRLVDGLTGEFLGGYGEVTARTASAAAALNRIAFYRGTTLARTALHSCRQFKSYRLDLALSLIDDVRAERS